MSQPNQPELDLTKTPRLVTVSPSKLTTWVDCPRRFRFAYLDRPAPKKGPPWAHLSYGTSAHNALRSWWDLPLAQRQPEAAGTLVRQGWLTDGYRDDAQSAAWREVAAEQVTTYASTLDAHDEPLGVERTVGMRTSVLAFSGRVDRIDEREGELVIVDYKVGRSVPSETDTRASMQLALYAAASERMFHRGCRRVELHHLPSQTVAAWEHSESSLGRHLDRAEGIGNEIGEACEQLRQCPEEQSENAADELFPTHAGPMCGWCDFRGVCPDGQAAGPARQSWDALADLPVVET